MVSSFRRRAVLVAAGVATIAVLLVTMPKADPRSSPLKVAFVGNSITFVNDLPRLMEVLSGDRIYQSSCLHGSLNLKSILLKGNGMYGKWHTEPALIDQQQQRTATAQQWGGFDGYYTNYSMLSTPVYDYGICTVSQLILGYDINLSPGNENGRYINDGMNPCFQDPDYYTYLANTYHPPQWDYVVMNDQTTCPGSNWKRQRSLRALTHQYVSMFAASSSRPVFIVTHGYTKATAAAAESQVDDTTNDDVANAGDDDAAGSSSNRHGGAASSSSNGALGDIPEFTSRVYYGYQLYQQALAERLPQKPLLAPAGLAFLLVWEEDYVLWTELFLEDGFHPSPGGTYLIGCVLYATLYGKMPPTKYALPDDIGTLFSRARRMSSATSSISSSNEATSTILSRTEAAYLYDVAERVVLQGQRPTSLLDSETVAAMEYEEMIGSARNLARYSYD